MALSHLRAVNHRQLPAQIHRQAEEAGNPAALRGLG